MRIQRIIGYLLLIFLMGGCGIEGNLSSQFDLPDDSKNEEKTVTFGRVPAETVISLLRDHAPLVELLERKLNIDIQLSFAGNYNEILEGMSENYYDFVFLGPFSYVQSRDNSSYQAIVRPERFGNDWYRGIIFTHKQWEITNLKELRGHSLAFVDKDSASGYLFPKATFIENGIDPRSENFRTISFLGRHDRVVRAVYRGEYTAGATYKDARQSANLPGDVDPDQVLPILAETRKIPTSPIAVSKNFRENNPELVEQIIHTLIHLEDIEGGAKTLERLGIDRYIRSQKGDYGIVEKVQDTIQEKTKFPGN